MKFDMTRTVLIVLFRKVDSEILTSFWLVIAQGHDYDVIYWSDHINARKALPYRNTMLAAILLI